jgi:hypothetical protein
MPYSGHTPLAARIIPGFVFGGLVEDFRGMFFWIVSTKFVNAVGFDSAVWVKQDIAFLFGAIYVRGTSRNKNFPQTAKIGSPGSPCTNKNAANPVIEPQQNGDPDQHHRVTVGSPGSPGSPLCPQMASPRKLSVAGCCCGLGTGGMASPRKLLDSCTGAGFSVCEW